MLGQSIASPLPSRDVSGSRQFTQFDLPKKYRQLLLKQFMYTLFQYCSASSIIYFLLQQFHFLYTANNFSFVMTLVQLVLLIVMPWSYLYFYVCVYAVLSRSQFITVNNYVYMVYSLNYCENVQCKIFILASHTIISQNCRHGNYYCQH